MDQTPYASNGADSMDVVAAPLCDISCGAPMEVCAISSDSEDDIKHMTFREVQVAPLIFVQSDPPHDLARVLHLAKSCAPAARVTGVGAAKGKKRKTKKKKKSTKQRVVKVAGSNNFRVVFMREKHGTKISEKYQVKCGAKGMCLCTVSSGPASTRLGKAFESKEKAAKAAAHCKHLFERGWNKAEVEAAKTLRLDGLNVTVEGTVLSV